MKFENQISYGCKLNTYKVLSDIPGNIVTNVQVASDINWCPNTSSLYFQRVVKGDKMGRFLGITVQKCWPVSVLGRAR